MRTNKFNLMLLMSLALIGTLLMPSNVSAHPRNSRSRNNATIIIHNNNGIGVRYNTPYRSHNSNYIRHNIPHRTYGHPYGQNNNVIIIHRDNYGWGDTSNLYPVGSLTLNSDQRDRLIHLLHSNRNNDSILNRSQRSTISSQRNLLPSRVRRQIQRGRTLPSGITSQVLLPRSVNDHLGLSSRNVNAVVIGSDVVFINPMNGLVLDVVPNAF